MGDGEGGGRNQRTKGDRKEMMRMDPRMYEEEEWGRENRARKCGHFWMMRRARAHTHTHTIEGKSVHTVMAWGGY